MTRAHVRTRDGAGTRKTRKREKADLIAVWYVRCVRPPTGGREEIFEPQHRVATVAGGESNWRTGGFAIVHSPNLLLAPHRIPKRNI